MVLVSLATLAALAALAAQAIKSIPQQAQVGYSYPKSWAQVGYFLNIFCCSETICTQNSALVHIFTPYWQCHGKILILFSKYRT